jgi:hypothetical protein
LNPIIVRNCDLAAVRGKCHAPDPSFDGHVNLQSPVFVFQSLTVLSLPIAKIVPPGLQTLRLR